MAFGAISTFYIPTPANAGASMFGTDVRKLLATADAALDASSRTDHGTSGSVSQKFVDPYTTRSAAGSIIAGWAVDPITDMDSVSGARRIIPAGNHVTTTRLATNAVLGGTLSQASISIWKVAPGPGYGVTLVGATNVNNIAIPAGGYATCTFTTPVAELIFEPGETILYIFAISSVGLIITGIINTFATGTQGGIPIRIDHPGLAILKNTVGSASGSGVASGVTAQHNATVGSSANNCTVSGVTSQTQLTAGTSVNTCTVNGVASQSQLTTGTASGAGVVNGSIAQTYPTVGSASGSCTVDGVVLQTQGTVGSVAGTSTVDGNFASITSTIGAAAGTSIVSGVIEQDQETIGSAAGTSTVNGVPAKITLTIGTASGTSDANGALASVGATIGVSFGTSQVDGVAAQTNATIGAATGTSTADGAFGQVAETTGTANGTSTATANTALVMPTVGTVDIGEGGDVTIIRPIYLFDD